MFVNGANETAVPVTALPASTGVNGFTPTTFIGAVQNASDTSFAGWTCNASYVNFGSTSGNCTALPTTTS